MKRILIGASTLLMLAGCSLTPTTPKAPLPDSVAGIETWHTEGRVGIRTADDAVSGNFNWQHSPSQYQINIYGPFGQGATRIEGLSDGTTTLKYDDKTLTGPSAEAMLYREFGWQFPVTQVKYWIRGLPAPSSQADIQVGSDGVTPTQITQDGWTINYREFTQIEHLTLPQKIQVAKAPYRVNLIITNWDLQ
ncbi:lipoprotein insertase outer membrane protein LolB [Marinomonas ostreistagni]|uniref:lipoprotein insertase outer membrane protein LolB n=1 Tax=Marinomonas ostreistagni TaxID=359209 RepID=UPI00194DBED2|nr:lipoprotein insertase outer membrane protein LolB [Marinomonas ostreistagni]MBM6551602.1 outer membrane lipoprotein LolB [Marinomonas ostreistagni]